MNNEQPHEILPETNVPPTDTTSEKPKWHLVARKRLMIPLAPTEDLNNAWTVQPRLRPQDLAPGVTCIRVFADHSRGMWYAILDVTNAVDADAATWWAPGTPIPVLVPQESVDALAAVAPQPDAAVKKTSPIILPTPGNLAAIDQAKMRSRP